MVNYHCIFATTDYPIVEKQQIFTKNEFERGTMDKYFCPYLLGQIDWSLKCLRRIPLSASFLAKMEFHGLHVSINILMKKNHILK
jgi:hypothetical protein